MNMISVSCIAILVVLTTVSSERHIRHHRRSISYDERWFGFRFEAEPVSVTWDGRPLIVPCTFALARERRTTVEWKKDSTSLNLSDKRLSLLSNGSLLLSDLSSSLTGVFQCVVNIHDEDGATWTFISRKASIRMIPTLKWKEHPKSSHFPRGRPAILKCRLEDSPPSISMKWKKNGEVLSDTDRVTLSGGIMEIRRMDKEDEGVYWCEANAHTLSTQSNKATLVVSPDGENEEMHFLSSPSSMEVVEGEGVILECLVSNDAIVEWYKDAHLVSTSSTISKLGLSSLVISSCNSSHSGAYTCKASHASDSIESTAIVTVLVPPLITIHPQDSIAMESSDIELECTSIGNPLPSLTWFKNGEALITSEYFVMEGNTLKILGLVKTDQGMYECFVENAAGNVHSSAQLLVDSLDSSSIASSSGHPVLASPPQSLNLISVGSREASLSWQVPTHIYGSVLYYHLYYKEDGSDRERVVNCSERLCTLTDLQPGTSYLLRVAAENEAGIGESSRIVRATTNKEQEVPGRVEGLIARAISSESIEVSWKKSTGGGAPPIRYTLFYVRSDMKDNERETQVNVPSTAYTMHGMDKYTQYDIRVEAVGEMGAGLSSNAVTVETLSDLPSSPPIDISISPISTSSIRVSWKVDSSFSNGPLVGTRLRYKTKQRGSKAVTLLINEPAREHIVNELEAGMAYQMRLSLANENGTGPYSDWMTGETPLVDKDETLLGAPRELRTMAGVDFVDIQWRPPSDENEKVVRGYQIGWGLNVPDVETRRVSQDVHQYRISSLKGGRDYVISVRAFNAVGIGFPIYETLRTLTSNPVAKIHPDLTEEGSDVDAPLGVQSTVVSATAIRVTWPENGHFNVQYTVRYSTRGDSAFRFVNSSESSIVIDKLKPGTEYEMAVRANVPDRGVSPWSMTVTHSTLAAPPSSAPRDLTVLPAASGDPHSVTVNWQPAKYANGDMQEYIIYYTDKGGAREKEWSSVVVPADRLSHPLDNLLPKTTYYFRIQAKNIKGLGPMSSIQVYSPSSVSFIHPVQTSNVNTSNGWKGIMESMGSNLLYFSIVVAVLVLILLFVILVCVCIAKKLSRKNCESSGYCGGRNGSSEGKNDLWIQHGVAGTSSHVLCETASLTDIKNDGRRKDCPPRYNGGTLARREDPYAALIPRGGGGVSVCSYEESCLSYCRPSIITPSLAPQCHTDRSGTLSRSYQHSSTSLDQRLRTPQMICAPRGPLMKTELTESPYGSSVGVGGSGTPPPPSLAPPQPPIVSADTYRNVRGGGGNGMNGPLGSFNPPSIANRGRTIPVGRATAQPRVNVANLCSSYATSSVMSLEDEKARMREERDDETELHPLQGSVSTLHEEVDNIDHMISDLQALQQQFGVNS